eukprot:TRINITY_DN18953_c0_g1_i1.p1 TRINITY_DN18953_c0_g1~~TRINITY_DN18953_c0_g1_i1.p1  ORF type:complete len:772 (+),score=130.48 TRINITY_DN18953_c0_g1_i1:57-2318(+)
MVAVGPPIVGSASAPAEAHGLTAPSTDSIGGHKGPSSSAPRLMGISDPLPMRLVNWDPAACAEWVEGPLFPGGSSRRLPIGPDLLIDRTDFALGEAPPGFRRLALGSSVKLRFAYVVTCQSVREEDGRVVEISCTIAAGWSTGFDGVSKGLAIVNWVHASSHETVTLRPPVSGVQLLCEPAISRYLVVGSDTEYANTSVHIDSVGVFRVERLDDGGDAASSKGLLALVTAARQKAQVTTAAQGKRPRRQCTQRRFVGSGGSAASKKVVGVVGGNVGSSREGYGADVASGTSVSVAAAAADILALPVTPNAYLYLVCASERWGSLVALELREAWRAACRDPNDLVEVARGLYRDCASRTEANEEGMQAISALASAAKVEGLREFGFDVHCPAHVAGLRRRLRLLCAPQSSPEMLVEAAGEAALAFPGGFCLETECPCPPRPEATAPYVSASVYLPAALARVIGGRLLPQYEVSHGKDGEAQDSNLGATSGACVRRLVIVETSSPTSFLLAEDCPPSTGRSFESTLFCDTWRRRPFPDYSASLEPLAAMAMLSVGLRVHERIYGSERPPAVFVDPACGTGTLPAAARFCRGASWAVMGGDVNRTIIGRAAANLTSLFPGAHCVFGEDELRGHNRDASQCPEYEGCPEILLRHHDASQGRWPVPSLPGLRDDGADILVAANLPWGHAVAGKEEDAAGIVRSFARLMPGAVCCFIVAEALRIECTAGPEPLLEVLHVEPVGKKAALLVCRGVSAEVS